mmetsp:Transcript_46276/g.91730  ORF Transcript_46276/g.91730 Transcript_46276/m.91730 type:complete len:92 (+) Transcript_46276:572-847(+)
MEGLCRTVVDSFQEQVHCAHWMHDGMHLKVLPPSECAFLAFALKSLAAVLDLAGRGMRWGVAWAQAQINLLLVDVFDGGDGGVLRLAVPRN